MLRLIILSLFSFALFFTTAPKVSVAQQYKYGTVDFNVSCNETVQADFDRALAMLHNMMYVTARKTFNEITDAAPNCAMAYWGVATTLFQPLWGTQPSEEDLLIGWRNSKKALELVNSEREKSLVKATASFFQNPEETDFWTRINRWADGMETAYYAYPGDFDIAAFYGLSRLTLAQTAEDREPLHDETEIILREIFEQVPSHPGAIHYTIHSTDVDGRAENALDMVEAYGKIAPDVPHALHMPTHIYVRLGDWPEIIRWNKKSAEAALDHPVDGAVSHHYLHAIDYLVYAYLQQGEDEKIEPLVETFWEKGRYQASTVSSYHFAAIPARLGVERRDWKQAAAVEPRTPEYLPWDEFPWAEGISWFARGMGAVNTGDIEGAREAEQQLRNLRKKAKSSGADDMASYIEIDRRILDGWIVYKSGEAEKAVELIRSAAELESTTEKHPVTPGALLPANEALGELLMKLDRPAEALEAYKASNAIWPERYNTLLGAARAARKAGNESTAQKYYERLLDNARDSKRTGIREARGSVTKN
ncbi:MAG: hypothetical protein HUJ22_00820 [Gracilimonas sp.]|uniref:tetratricopeptide repeat protein n=1 Tax=Gracilimonas sp. TaxID=1974203 RepID=UPI0019901CA2|nr:hypothetical protein [Gracilimonas sp.]MBD3615083.1 hypothetical protein [Gracilimonas sp.]